ncbi:uncharacterized protein M421DRAFT_99063 [Didymella exigua CBS 183.55]|uniref:Integral membrane protein TmpA n=1 Tax=Didymella exigua CBS 183.55 TaxID=1150837 RepID=A0A6A5RUJ2_9PLEO|nr:uncharacterized protein M421DRAFT_99063 [Didymella exigua CBS 183.55]KAF1931153.1 hypothetical protein M421DRAFT_99063 [Didymella exigua CBS 183.55]
MSYIQKQRDAAGPVTTPCRYQHWWRERQRSHGQRGRSPVRPAAIPSDRPTAVFDPDRLPPTGHHRAIRRLRYGVFAVYQRLFTLVVVLNLAAVLVLLRFSSWRSLRAFRLDNLATLASSNLLLAILFRQDWLINLLFRTAWLVPWSLPLRARRVVSRVYCYGGIHSGAAVVGTGWWIGFTGVLSWECVARGGSTVTAGVLVLTLIIASLLVAIVVLSLPRVRARHHDVWELTHRFLGWSCVALFWAQLLLLTRSARPASTTAVPHALVDTLVRTPSFWTLGAITALLVYPWLLLRRWTFTATPLSAHALLLSFPHAVHKYSCVALSTQPAREWHPFATFPLVGSSESQSGNRNALVVSAAGDWTRSLISSAQQKSGEQKAGGAGVGKAVSMRFFVKSHPRAGVLSLSCMYARVLIVTTGSGIGPSLSSLLDRPAAQRARLVWSTRAPVATYGAAMLRLVHRADPQALVLDTDAQGRPDLLRVAWGVCREMGAEAVFVLSNERVTRWVVGGLESRGVPAFGPIWDS